MNSFHFCCPLGFHVQESKSSTRLLHIILGSSVLLFLELIFSVFHELFAPEMIEFAFKSKIRHAFLILLTIFN